MPTREAVLAEFLSRASQIQKVNGYRTDAGLYVLFGEAPVLGEGDPATAIGIMVGDDQVEDASDDVQTTLPVDIIASTQISAAADAASPWLTIEALIGDICKAIESGSRDFNGLLTTRLMRGRTRRMPREGGSSTVSAARQYTAKFLDAWGG